ncbi:MAG: LapA family protein [Pseudomonadales bacterium]|nr:LapA family protein [Pseudomonadales bacterium]
MQQLIRRILFALIALALAAYVVFFTLANHQLLDLDLLFIQLNQVPVELALILSFIAGGLSGIVAAFGWVMHYRKQLNKARIDLKRAGL